ncbi:hypothetical protein GDO78_001811 [Eleutherodactylus coqui]|uniref:Uncharacterized protein n=1 Tax=Eleutherodactylus coqui TaxID=57060 RepID=A0A8J6KP32_ELECQ|nr:hypothetical protein GDO78_001811 [Eleutherodactylus coqui]
MNKLLATKKLSYGCPKAYGSILMCFLANQMEPLGGKVQRLLSTREETFPMEQESSFVQCEVHEAQCQSCSCNGSTSNTHL